VRHGQNAVRIEIACELHPLYLVVDISASQNLDLDSSMMSSERRKLFQLERYSLESKHRTLIDRIGSRLRLTAGKHELHVAQC
jgi:hypothetical protein